MPLDVSTRTLYEDWLARRERLLAQPITPGDGRAAELRLLEYLLRRYKDTPEAARPARPPLSKGLYVNDRAIIVHHYLGGGQSPTIRNAREAHTHVRTLVERMSEAKAKEATFFGNLPAGGPRFRDPNPILEAARNGLCHQDPVQRVLAAVQLGVVGTLEDIGLLSDLLALPVQPDEHPRERAAWLHAMRRISGETTARFDLTALAADASQAHV